MLKKIILILVVMGLWQTTVDAALLLDGASVFVTGDASELDGFSPGSDGTLLMNDAGTNGDLVADDGIFSLDRNQSASTANGISLVTWKAASVGFSPVEVPASFHDSLFRPNSSSTIKFVLDTRTFGDGFLPDPNGFPGSGRRGVVYTVPSVFLTSETLRITGAFQSQLSGSGDWDPTDPNPDVILLDDGVGGDATAGDSVFSTSITGLSPNTYNYKFTTNGSFNLSIGSNGVNGGGNLSFLVLNASDTLTFEVQTATGRYRVTSDNPAVSAGPPWFATSVAWGLARNASTALFDDGTNGDVVSADGIYSRTFISTLTSNPSGTLTTTTLQVEQNVGIKFPGGDGYPFTVNQSSSVLVQFDTNVVNDGFVPVKNYVWTDPASRRPVDYVQVVGSFMLEFGLSSDWDINASSAQLFDSGSGGDVVSGDGIFAHTFSNPALTGTRVWKAIGLANSWDYQFGGETEGATLNGSNANILFSPQLNQSFTADVVTGRVALGLGLPLRPVTINSTPPTGPSVETAVDEWMLYE